MLSGCDPCSNQVAISSWFLLVIRHLGEVRPDYAHQAVNWIEVTVLLNLSVLLSRLYQSVLLFTFYMLDLVGNH